MGQPTGLPHPSGRNRWIRRVDRALDRPAQPLRVAPVLPPVGPIATASTAVETDGSKRPCTTCPYPSELLAAGHHPPRAQAVGGQAAARPFDASSAVSPTLSTQRWSRMHSKERWPDPGGRHREGKNVGSPKSMRRYNWVTGHHRWDYTLQRQAVTAWGSGGRTPKPRSSGVSGRPVCLFKK
jgi:hypothetical protein